jgi:hypothetical protein
MPAMPRLLALGVVLLCGCVTERYANYHPVREAWKLAYRVSEVHDLMLLSQQRAGTDAVVERTGYLSWQVTSSRGTADCNVLTRDRYHCEPDLEAEVAPTPPRVRLPSAPPLPGEEAPMRKPLRASYPSELRRVFAPMGPTVSP